MTATIAEATTDTFDELVAQGRVLVDVWGPDCRPCVALMPTVAELAEAHPEVTVVKVEAPKARRLCMRLKVMGLPAFLMFQDGTEVARLADPVLSAAKLIQWVESNLEDKEGVS